MKSTEKTAAGGWLCALFLGLAFFFGCGRQTNAPSTQVTQNVFIVIIDGLRNTEAFEEPTHRYIPHIWNDLRPQGAIYTEFYNLGKTQSTAAHNSIVTGNWELSPPGYDTSAYPLNPTIFEYYRKEKGIAKNGVWYVGGNSIILPMLYSLDPQYGATYSASYKMNTKGDILVWNDLQDVMDTYHPSLVLVNFCDVDKFGHLGVWKDYTNAILGADQLVYDLWQKIQLDPVYKDKTMMLVLSDHGRHDDEHGGFTKHGGICHGCRHIPFLAIGPDIKKGVEINSMATLIDIAPTIGNLLGFSTPLSRGHLLSEMLLSGVTTNNKSAENQMIQQDQSLTSSQGVSGSPAMVAGNNGVIHAVWAGSWSGYSEIYYSKSANMGNTWSIATQISNSGFYAGLPSLAVDTFGAHIVWIEYRDSTWHLFYRKSPDQGNTWSKENLLYSSKYEGENSDSPVGTPWSPSIVRDIMTDSMMVVFAFYPYGIFSLYSMDGWATWTESRIETSVTSPNYFLLYPSAAVNGSNIFAVWQGYVADEALNFEIYFGKSIDKGATWSTPVRLTFDSGFSFMPVITTDGATIYVVWSDYRNREWQIYLIKSDDSGLSWMPEKQITNSSAGAWKADLLQKDGKLYLVWVDYRDGDAEIYYKMSSDKGVTWSDDVRLTNNSGLSINPKFVKDLKKIIYEDNLSGNWEIYFRSLP